MPRLVLPITLFAVLAAGVTLAQFEPERGSRGVQTASALGLCLKTGIGCSR